MTRITKSNPQQGGQHGSTGPTDARGPFGSEPAVAMVEKPSTLDQVFDGTQANKGMLADEVSRRLNAPRRTAYRWLDAVLDSVTGLLQQHGRVAVKGFGTFERKIRKGRAYKHPLTGKSIDVPDKETVLFKPSQNLIEAARPGSIPRTPQGGGDSSQPV
jgi:nucleoid DNA-binding protein